MSYERNIKWLNDRRIIYRRDPISDKPTIQTDQYIYYEYGTYECYTLFNSKAKITTYRSLKWHMLVLYYLNIDGIEGDEISLEDDMTSVFKFISNKENGFVTFFIRHKLLDSMIEDVIKQGGDPPKNKIRKVIFRDYSGLTLNEKLKIVGQLVGRQSKNMDEESIYQCMLEIHEGGYGQAYYDEKKITYRWMSELLGVSERTLYRHMTDELKQIKKELNEKL